MLFNSIDFAVFLPLVFLLYWTVFHRTLRMQNAFLLVVSAIFYGWWDPRYLILVFISAAIDWSVALGLERTTDPRPRKLLLALSMTANLGMLGFFKYYDFFIINFNEAFQFLGMPLSLRALNVVLPVGISFYTFQTMSYTIDVYRRQIPATRDPVAFSAYVLFFPQLVAGPIERASALMPQFEMERIFDASKARDGLKQILWGLFKKVVIADSCALYVDKVYDMPEQMSGATLALATILFAFQIYGDFSGYSDIAIGTSRLFGFNLMRNFAFPYFSRDMAEFWRRWHISLSTWFRDYLYIPLGGSRGTKLFSVRNSIIVFVVSGFWHGASWNFLIWGALNGLYFLPLVLTNSNRNHLGPVAHGRWFPDLRELRGMLTTFLLACMAWVFFRARGLDNAVSVYRAICSESLFQLPLSVSGANLKVAFLAVAVMLTMEWVAREQQHALQLSPRLPAWARWTLYYGVVALIIVMAPITEASFIYFQF
ncbi:MAG: MBOAT family protein [Flavobacteriales bacterium]|jgi:alginate O-acetyltransferase complex protein AlgI|nr:MBOAT family protein [Flavobacteriales bacterium]HOZ41019.1 MBOAT family O-acyltransferase [Flavobacteriales bacterium]